jgi:hypothetical protein
MEAEGLSESEEIHSKLNLIYASLLAASGLCAYDSSRFTSYTSKSESEKEYLHIARDHLLKARELYSQLSTHGLLLTQEDKLKYELVLKFSDLLTESEETRGESETKEKRKTTTKYLKRKKKEKKSGLDEREGGQDRSEL